MTPSPQIAAAPPPPCPITGKPTRRLVHWVGPLFLMDLWRHAGGFAGGHRLRPAGRFGLWKSPTGLIFFDPMLPGDEAFYSAFTLASTRTRRSQAPARSASSLWPRPATLNSARARRRLRARRLPVLHTGLDPDFAAEDPTGTALAEGVALSIRKPF